ncbi:MULTISPECIES: proline dehydrogenase family protein [unclassified Pseudodesulfovibrio]|uniref:proline dehydrogenase family protein n=1 Tax=unclassified Pseudodesulfovibrio TaxID=2661612 RepID=UPI000FEBF2B2|nr:MULTISPECIES: proline dehydrogenase family protein [unclassified Pseudodesulfovibrio]MCJ2163096.1 proline dehydrogenase family protein [Pseudodesulfovibrio sp. S3-i]RWU07088.1 aldehyde dehydrogenase family protein [Pseudodesulfovibrio sp. S3]
MSTNTTSLDPSIITRGREFFTSISGESPSVFNKGWWTGKVMDWAMKNDDFKVQMFRFVDVLPYLNTSESLSRHIEEYFATEDSNIPDVLKWGATKTKIGGGLVAKVLNRTIRSNIESMARQFIIGQEAKEAVKGIKKLRKEGFSFVLDLLGEATVSEVESAAYRDGYLEVLDAIQNEMGKWKPLDDGANELDWGHAPKVNVAVKPSAFYSQSKPVDLDGTATGMLASIEPIYKKVMEMGGFMCIDMESLKYKEATVELYKRLRTKYPDYPHLGIVFQAYLRSVDDDVHDFISWAREKSLPVSIRLVKGAYWDYETVIAKQNDWSVPVWTHKPESDMAYERVSRYILENSDICHFACASHNIRTIAAVMETAAALNVPEERYEFQVLYGMAEPVRKGLKNVAKRVRLYCPYGDLLPGMAYLVRRLLENTANESFLKQTFADEADMDRLLENPEITLRRQLEGKCVPEEAKTDGLPRFSNFPAVDFTIEAERQAFPASIAKVRAAMGGQIPLFINGRDVVTGDTLDSYNPADPSEIVGSVCQAGVGEVDRAIEAASEAYLSWRDVAPRERAEALLKASQYLKDNIYDLSALQVLEVGKQWDQAHADVAEAIDFLEYYAREMIRLGAPRRMGRAPGEMSQLFYQGKGVAAVIAPWNFPLAISVGMVSAAIVSGCPVVYKPAGISSCVGRGMVDMWKAAGLPDGVFNYCPGRGAVMGDHLVDHPDVSVIAFTGSMEVGLRIQERAAKVQPGQMQCKQVIAEMGGKNATIIDDDADLDEAVLGVLYAAFGFQGQKCSACSRVIVLDSIYDRFVDRLTEAAKSVKLGPSENPANYMGPVVDRAAQENVMRYVKIAEEEGNLLVKREVSDDLKATGGCFVPLTIVDGITKEHRIAQEEVFGPVLVVMRASDMDEALDIANSTKFALTGAIYSRSPHHLERAYKEFRVGNLYLNKPSVGALVERHAFGGFKMSGVGSKAGGPDYLLQFLDPRLVCENTIRRGFAPIEEDDDWLS